MQEKIVVFKQYDNTMEAHIAASKLDAHGIPCFLSEENLAGLYPLQALRSIGIRLHIFASDAERVRQLLAEIKLNTSDSV